MADYPPFMNATGLVAKILGRVKQAQTPDRFTSDFLASTLGFTGGSARSFIAFAKRLGLLGTDGSPTDLYKSFRNPSQSKKAVADAIRRGYQGLYSRNERLHELPRKDLEGLVIESTGLDKGSATLRAICGTFEQLKSLADFTNGAQAPEASETNEVEAEGEALGEDSGKTASKQLVKMNLAYTIYLNLPKTDDIAVFNAIFKSLRENLLHE